MKDKKKNSGLKIYIVVPAIVGILCVASIVIAVVMGAPEKVNAARVSKQLELGNKYLNSAEYDKAEVAFNKSLRIDPKSVEAATGMAKVYNEKEQPEDAVKYLKKAADNITTPEQVQELQKVLSDTKQQIGNSTGDINNNTNYKWNFGDIEAIIDERIREIIRKRDMVTPTPTPTGSGDDIPGPDSGNDEGSNGQATPDPTDNPTAPSVTPDPTAPSVTPEPDNPTEPPVTLEPDNPTDPPVTPEPDDPTEPPVMPEPNNPTEPPVTPEPDNPTDPSVTQESYDPSEPSVTPEEILNNYEINVLPSEVPQGGFIGTSISYTYGDESSAANVMTGRLAEKQQDLDGDGIPELLVVEMQSGKIGFRIYKVKNGVVEITASQTISTGIGKAVQSVSYGNTQVCFLMNNNGIYEIGFASYCYGYDAGDGTPAVRTNVEVYSVAVDGSVSACASGSVQNGQGQDGFSGSLVPAGMNGSWNSSNAETLQSMGYAENPYQDALGVPNPLSGGIASGENGAEDLIIVNAEMSAESGMLNVR